jgi:SAM-dependent methyltransferase
MDSTHPDFWETRYRAGRTPWDFQGVPPALADFLRRGSATNDSGNPARPAGEAAPPPPSSPPLPSPRAPRVLLPGCGLGYEVAAFHAHGWRAQAIDFAPAAVELARAQLGALANCVRQADFFGETLDGPYDLIYERTFLCSMPLERRAAYAKQMARLLRPGGVLAGVFFSATATEDGPPFPIAPEEARQLFAAFELIEDRPIPADQSLPLFVGQERWQIWRLREC